MAYLPISKLVPQFVDSNGDPYSGAVLKAYEAGTSTVLSMATDSTGGTTATSMALNSDGYVEVSSNIVIPHVNENFKLSLYPTQTAADANSGAIWTIDNIKYLSTPSIADNGNATAMTIDSSEDISYVGTAQYAAGEGVVFNGDAIDADHTLDDYEEGTWTPVLSDGTNVATSSVEVGLYTKIGRKVDIVCYLATSSLGSVSGDLRITGLPFAANSTLNAHVAINVGYGTGLAITAGQNVGGYVVAANTYIELWLWDAITGTTAMQESEWTADGGIMVTATYFV